MKKIIAVLFVLCFVGSSLFAQTKKIEYGIKAGGNFSKMFGPSELGSDGSKLEKNKINFRVMAGAYARYKLTDRIGLQAELLYMQKGGSYKFDGPSFDSLQTQTVEPDSTHRVYTLNTTLNYLEVPVSFYWEAINDKIEINFGASFGLLTGATALGNTKYTDNLVEEKDASGNFIPGEIEQDLIFKYNKDGAGVASTTYGSVYIDRRQKYYSTTLGAYSEITESYKSAHGNFFNPFDLSVHAGLTWRASGSLRLGFRWEYSLLDVTNNAYDFSKVTAKTARADKDGNMGFQLYVAFGF